MIMVIGRFPVREGRGSQFGNAYTGMVDAVRAEAGCEHYSMMRPLEDESVFVLIEQWSDADAFARHVQAPHSVAFAAQMPDLLAGPPQLTRHEVVASDVLSMDD